MIQQGQVFKLKLNRGGGSALWAYRYRLAGRGSKRVQRGGFGSERDAAEALERALERLRREQRVSRSLTLAELVDEYLAQHDVEPATIAKLRWLLGKAVRAFRRAPAGRAVLTGDRGLADDDADVTSEVGSTSQGGRFNPPPAARATWRRAITGSGRSTSTTTITATATIARPP